MDLWEHFAFVLSASTGSMLTLTRQDSAWEFQSCHVRKEWCTRTVGGTSLLSSGLPRTSWHLKLKRPPLHTNRFQRPKEPLTWSNIVCSNSYTTDFSNPTLLLNKTISFKKNPAHTSEEDPASCCTVASYHQIFLWYSFSSQINSSVLCFQKPFPFLFSLRTVSKSLLHLLLVIESIWNFWPQSKSPKFWLFWCNFSLSRSICEHLEKNLGRELGIPEYTDTPILQKGSRSMGFMSHKSPT